MASWDRQGVNRRALLFTTLAPCLGIGMGFASNARASTSWRLASGYRKASFQTQNLLRFANEVSRATQGAITISVHPDGSLLKLRDIFPALTSGQVEMGEVISGVFADSVSLAGLDAVPFIVASYDDARRLWAAQRPRLAEQLRNQGLHLLYAVPWPPQGLYTVNPVHRSADLAGQRMRTFDATTTRIAELMGASGVDVPMIDLPQALQAGSIDAMLTSAVTGTETQAWSRMRHFYSVNAFFPKNFVMVRRDLFAAQPAHVQNAITQAAATAEQAGWEDSRRQEELALATLQANGLMVQRPGTDLANELHRLGERLSKEWVQSVGHQANYVLVPYFFK